MALSNARKVVVGETPYAHEREALDWAFGALPDTDPYHAWALFDLLEPSTGRLYEIDLLVLGYSALYLVEVKSGPGRYEGDHQEWWRTPPGEAKSRYMDGPLGLANLKAKVLRSRLQPKLRNRASCPFVQPLIFLSANDLDLRLDTEGMISVVTKQTLRAALQSHEFPGSNPQWRGQKIDRAVMLDVAKGLQDLGLRARKGKMYVESYELGDILADGAGYQDRAAKHRDQGFERRARTYLVPQAASIERRQQLRRAADREATLLHDVREHPNILRMENYVTDAPLGPTVLFDAFVGGLPLDVLLRHVPDLSFEERLTIVEQVGRALGYCHRRGIIHGAVAPHSVLARRHPETNAIETRLFNFQLGAGRDVEVTQHWSALAQEGWAVYQAPELRENPLARSVQSDLFSLGALAYFVFTGRAPGERVADVDHRLARERFLDPRTVDDGTRKELAEVFEFATAAAPVHRADNVEEWLDILLEEATAPNEVPAATEIDPLEAREAAILGGELEVQKVLGVGATARVLLVKRLSDDRLCALKIPSDPSHADRFVDEAELLDRLPKHPRIVELLGKPKLKEHACLLLSVAGDSTLQQKLARLGPVSLDEASRYGDDLLYALEHLEEHQVQHRDIKPANLGVGSVSKGADHLTLFDFSLARLPASEIQMGTAVYRDPYLRSEGRGAWDFAADRWGAAITLHEMLAGTRPTVAGGSAIDPDAKLTVAAERFDALVRDQLVEFFEKAFARDVATRFASAQEMRHAWVGIVGVPARSSKAKSKAVAAAPEPEAEVVQLTDEQMAHIADDAPVATLPITTRARNALDRAGLMRARDLLDLAPNRLSAIRGVGHLVAREILEFRDRWRALRPQTAAETAPFFPGYAGDDLHVATAALDARMTSALASAGFATLRAVAVAPASQVESVCAQQAIDVGILRALLVAENLRANQREKPTTLEGWVEALIPTKKKAVRLVRALYGLDAPFEGRIDLTVRELADAVGNTTAAVYIALGKAREEWIGHDALGELRERLTRILEESGGAISLRDAAQQFVETLPHDDAADAKLTVARAAALVRALVEIDKEAALGARLTRLHDHEPWLFATEEHARSTRQLGQVADELANRAALAATGEARRSLDAIVRETPLAALKDARLFELAAAASSRAACSARLEIYPRNLDPRRAIELCAATFKGGVTADDVRTRVFARYPASAPLPDRPELDALLAPLGFVWDETSGKYARPGEAQTTTLETKHSSLGRQSTALPSQPRAMNADAIDARQFDEKLRHAIEMHEYRVLGVTADRARDASLALAARLEAKIIAFDVELAREIDVQRKKAGIAKDDIVHDADRLGARGPAWARLLRLVHAAAEAVADRILPPTEPLIIVQPGPIARYGLESFLQRLAQKSADDPAILLLVPMHDTGGMPRIQGTLSIPGILPSQALWVSRAWLANRHNAAA